MTATDTPFAPPQAGVRAETSPAGAAPQPPAAAADWVNLHAPDARAAAAAAARGRGGTARALRRVAANPTALAGAAILAVAAALALLAPALFPGDPMAMVGRPLLWPFADARFPLGTDSMGRDVLAGVAHGARVSLLVGVAATVIGFVVGVLVGAVGGYFGGWIDDALVRLTEIVQTMPSFVLLIVLVAILRPSAETTILGIAVVSWPAVARLTRAEFRAIREKDFVAAARGLGYGHGRIIFREILPNAAPALIVTTSIMVATAILMESALSFLGLGDPNVVSWGSMIGAGRELIRTAWYLTALPGLAIVLTVLALNLIGDGLNDALNPRYADDR
jgi:peptide/nickel transport system permease protein